MSFSDKYLEISVLLMLTHCRKKTTHRVSFIVEINLIH